MEITKSELAAHWGLSKPRITQLTKRGMPVLGSGKVDLDAAEAWRKSNVIRELGGWSEGIRQTSRVPQPVRPASKPPRGAKVQASGRRTAVQPVDGEKQRAQLKIGAALAGQLVDRAHMSLFAGACLEARLSAQQTFVLVAWLQLVWPGWFAAALASMGGESADIGPLFVPEDPDWKAFAAAAGEPLNLRAWKKAFSEVLDRLAAKGGK